MPEPAWHIAMLAKFESAARFPWYPSLSTHPRRSERPGALVDGGADPRPRGWRGDRSSLAAVGENHAPPRRCHQGRPPDPVILAGAPTLAVAGECRMGRRSDPGPACAGRSRRLDVPHVRAVSEIGKLPGRLPLG